MRIMTLYKPGRESDVPPTQDEMAAMRQFMDLQSMGDLHAAARLV